MKTLITLRGNSGSGKTTVASLLQKRFGRNTLLISQDMIRRDMLYAKDGENTEALPLMISLLQYGHAHCDTVILEGIMYADWYAPLFEEAVRLYEKNIYSYYFDLPFEETVRRHRTKPENLGFNTEDMRRWWREKDFSVLLREKSITKEKSLEDILDEIYNDVAKGQ